MIIFVYVITVIVFYYLAHVLTLPLVLIHLKYLRRFISFSFWHPTFFYSTIVCILLLHTTAHVWKIIGYDLNWILLTIISLIHFLLIGFNTSNRGLIPQYYGVIFGVIIYALAS